nr:transposase [Paenibacillus cellulosilyticus]
MLTCAAGQKLLYRYESKKKTESGYEIRRRHCRSENCAGCPLKANCMKAQGNREISVSFRYMHYKVQAREKLRSEEGYALSVR